MSADTEERHFLIIARDSVPDWALKRAKEITHCGWEIHHLRDPSIIHDQSYVFTIFKVARYVMEVEEEPINPLYAAVHDALSEALAPCTLAGIPGWPGTVPITLQIVGALTAAGLVKDEEDEED